MPNLLHFTFDVFIVLILMSLKYTIFGSAQAADIHKALALKSTIGQSLANVWSLLSVCQPGFVDCPNPVGTGHWLAPTSESYADSAC